MEEWSRKGPVTWETLRYRIHGTRNDGTVERERPAEQGAVSELEPCPSVAQDSSSASK